MSDVCQLVVLQLDDQRYALRLDMVERVIRALEIAPLPGAPASVLGVVNIQGQIMPVYDLRIRLGRPSQPLRLSDQIVLAHTASRMVCVCVDAVAEVLSFPQEQWVEAAKLGTRDSCVAGVAKLPDGLLLIHDLDRFLTPNEERALDQALELLG